MSRRNNRQLTDIRRNELFLELADEAKDAVQRGGGLKALNHTVNSWFIRHREQVPQEASLYRDILSKFKAEFMTQWILLNEGEADETDR